MKKLSIILCVIMMGTIFYMSSRTSSESNEKSFAVVNAIKQEYREIENQGSGVSRDKSTLPVTAREFKINIFLRKNAHVFEYFILALLVCNAFFRNKYKGKGIIIYILFICLFYAVTDEFHQAFVVGRTSHVSDVLIDFGGSLAGLGIYYFIYYWKDRKHKWRWLKSS